MILLSENSLEKVFPVSYEVAALINYFPDIIISSGSGLGEIWKRYSILQAIPYNKIPHMPSVDVDGHANELLIIEHKGKTALVFSGRFHLYEGHNLETVLLPVFLPYLYGVKNYLYLNAAGGLNPLYEPGDIMLITSLINFTYRKIIHLFNKQIFGVNSIAKDLFNSEWTENFENKLINSSIPFHKGTYIAVSGPSYETPSEVRFFRRIKGDAIGMSTALEALAGNLLGVNQLAISIITNKLSESYSPSTNHTEVLETITQSYDRIYQVINAALEASLD